MHSRRSPTECLFAPPQVILDSVAMLARLEYGTDQVAARQKLLAEQASLLKQAAERFSLPVVVVNQVTGGGDGTGPAGGQRAALGVVWAHAVNTRLVLDQQQNVRRVRVRCLAPVFDMGGSPVEHSPRRANSGVSMCPCVGARDQSGCAAADCKVPHGRKRMWCL